MDKLYLEELVAEGLSQNQIAEKSDCDRSTVKRWLKRYGLRTKNAEVYSVSYGPVEKSDLERMIDEGFTIAEIAERMNRSQTSARHWIEKYGLKTQRKSHLCNECGETDPNSFYGRRKALCKTCSKLRDALRMRKYKQELVREVGSKCVRCGYNKCLGALEFHHLDPSEKDPDFKTMRSWSKERKLVEVKKCELLCANCHREEHYERLSPSSLNGQVSAF